jgi:hypothetical protein
MLKNILVLPSSYSGDSHILPSSLRLRERFFAVVENDPGLSKSCFSVWLVTKHPFTPVGFTSKKGTDRLLHELAKTVLVPMACLSVIVKGKYCVKENQQYKVRTEI